MGRSVLLCSFLGSILLISIVHSLTLTPVWEITRPEEWAEITGIAIHYDGSGNPLVVCKTDSSVFTVDHTGTVSTIWTFTQNDTVTERFHSSPNARYMAISTSWAEGDTGRTGIRVMDATGTLIWEDTATPYWEISLADSGPWSVSSIPHIGRESTWDDNMLIRDPTGAIVHEREYPEHDGVSTSWDGTRVFMVGGDSIRCFDNSGSHLWTVFDPPPGLEEYWGVHSAGVPSGAIFAEYYGDMRLQTGKVFFRDSLGAPSALIDVAGGFGSMAISHDGEYVALGTYGTFQLIKRTPPSVSWSVTDQAGHRNRMYSSVGISADGALIVCGVSRADSLTSRLEIYNNTGSELLEEQCPTIGTVVVELTPDGSSLVLLKEQLTSLGRDQTLTLYDVIP